MARQMADLLHDEKGNLKPFNQWRQDIDSIVSHHTNAWLRTEYNTAVIRAHRAADWQQFIDNADVMPNLRWMPTTSPKPENSHAVYWRNKLTLPVNDPFWNSHHPGDRWNCKCTLQQTDEPVNPLPDNEEPTASHRGLDNNPGKDGHLFNQTHPYFPDKCSQCFAYKKSGLKNKVRSLFHNRQKDCFNCPFINGCLERPQAKQVIEQAARIRKEYILEHDLMPLSGDKNLENLNTGLLHLSGKSRRRLLTHAHHDYDVDAALHIWNNPQEMSFVKVSFPGEGKDLSDPKVQANIQKKINRHVIDYVEYEFEYNRKIFLVKLERLTFGKEQFYSILEK